MRPDSRRDAGKKPVHEISQSGLDLVVGEIGQNQAHSAVHVESDSARGDHAVVGIHGGDSADREAVSPMAVGHAEGIIDDTRKSSDIGHLVEYAFIHFLNQSFGLRNMRAGTRMPCL